MASEPKTVLGPASSEKDSIFACTGAILLSVALVGCSNRRLILCLENSSHSLVLAGNHLGNVNLVKAKHRTNTRRERVISDDVLHGTEQATTKPHGVIGWLLGVNDAETPKQAAWLMLSA